MRRVYLADGPEKSAVILHDLSAGPFVRRFAPRGGLLLYRIFGEAPAGSRDVCDLLAGEWCERCAMLRAHCAHHPAVAIRRWARFGPQLSRLLLDPGAPGSRESKWHLLRGVKQASEPWLTACDLIVYGPMREEYAHPVLTPVGDAMCRHCKRIAGATEQPLAVARS